MGMVKLEDGEYGRRAVITSKWRSEMSRYLLANDVLELELNYAKGWRGNDLSFLKELPQLRAFKIIDHFGLPTWSRFTICMNFGHWTCRPTVRLRLGFRSFLSSKTVD